MICVAHNANHVVTKAGDLVEKEGGLGQFFADVGFGGIGYSLILLVVSIVQGIQLAVVGPMRAIGRGTISLVDVMFVGFGDVFGAGTEETVRFFAEDLGRLLGPLAQPTAVGVVMFSIFVFVFAAQRIPWSPWVFVTNIRN